MIICELCGNVIPDTSAMCLFCGALSVFNRAGIHTPTEHGFGSLPSPIPDDEQAYHLDPQPGYAQIPGYGYPYPSLPMNYPATSIMTPRTLVAPASKRGALIVEVLLNLCLGIFGVGWLMAGETLTGLLLLACGIIIYWPIIIISAIISFTLSVGPGLGSLIPLALGAISLNAIFLSRTIKRKTQFTLAQSLQITPSS